jgi:hypothetical protein
MSQNRAQYQWQATVTALVLPVPLYAGNLLTNYGTTIFLEKPAVSHARNDNVLRSFKDRFPIQQPTSELYVDNSSITIFVEGLFQYYPRAYSAVSKVVPSLQISYQILISPMPAAFFTRLS